ncbi:GDSL-like Lipase/Acylhydrolase family/GDSL-like Lipase/Acylhydrolase, putative [Angomonas deanei]|uniref:GDSL-like Lipase/Acylhydrolase family/GDSL-like Lipase/Acylhydrolase, putative n=1 Tax=Angomonas deanei TaxID=59799 RepID=A0A7G2C5G8_9TRYP|nr:GDSL-like Lipase/Acylhydrolase family/GDSL-like Lipase/Acylhydrolase, putative [Angomonas deanei]
METILIMGASLMEYGYSSHWVSRLADAYARKAFVYNAGLAGYNSDWLHSILISDTLSTRLVPASMQRPLFITLMVGSNDCSHGLQHVPLARYKKNLHDIIDLLCQRFHPRLGVLVLSIPPIDEVRWPIGKMKKTDRTFADSLRYSEAMKEVVQGVQAAPRLPGGSVFRHLLPRYTGKIRYRHPQVRQTRTMDPFVLRRTARE